MHKQHIYIIDTLNIFSDFRETFYKRIGVDFHDVKYTSINNDTFAFFDLFFNEYIQLLKIPIQSKFIFVMKKINNYDEVLIALLHKYIGVDLKFIITVDKYTDSLIDQNKDDFICQYLLTVYDGSILISNDKYKNTREYTHLFLNMRKINLQIMQCSTSVLTNACAFFIINSSVINKIHSITFARKCIPKSDFKKILPETIQD
jgi:hypothetical protein